MNNPEACQPPVKTILANGGQETVHEPANCRNGLPLAPNMRVRGDEQEKEGTSRKEEGGDEAEKVATRSRETPGCTHVFAINTAPTRSLGI